MPLSFFDLLIIIVLSYIAISLTTIIRESIQGGGTEVCTKGIKVPPPEKLAKDYTSDDIMDFDDPEFLQSFKNSQPVGNCYICKKPLPGITGPNDPARYSPVWELMSYQKITKPGESHHQVCKECYESENLQQDINHRYVSIVRTGKPNTN